MLRAMAKYDAPDAAYVEEHLVAKYPKLAGPLRESRGKQAGIRWRVGRIDRIDTFMWKKPEREALFELLHDPHAVELRDLTLRDTAVADLAQFAHLSELEDLNFAWADLKKLKSLAPLAKLPKLAVLDVRHSKVTDLAPLKKLPLRKLTLGGTPVKDLKPLAKHPKLECIELDGTPVSDVRPLHACPRLCNVSLWDAKVSTEDAQALVFIIKKNRAQPSKNSDYRKYVSHNDADWYAKPPR